MANQTSIEWTDATWTPVKGCTRVSEGCRNCYAEIMTARFSKPGMWGEGLATIVDTPNGKDHRWTGKIKLDEAVLLKPLSWRKPKKIFVCSTSDLFQAGVPDDFIDKVFAVMALCPQHTFQVLTKRPGRMRVYFADGPAARIGGKAADLNDGKWRPIRLPLPNVWLGTSTENQAAWDERVPHLLATPAAVRWISAEPLIGPIDPSKIEMPPALLPLSCTRDDVWAVEPLTGRIAPIIRSGASSWALDGGGQRIAKVDWIVAGGESGPGARPMHPDWARWLRDQCAAAGVPFLFKQWGDWQPHTPRAGGDLGGDVRSGRVVTVNPSGRSIFEQSELTGRGGEPGCRYMERVGKAMAGRLLDGVLHDGYPS